MSGPVLLALRLLLTVLLYLFVGWALYTLWLDLRRQSKSLTANNVPPLTITRPVDGAFRTFRFTSPEVLIGRDPASDCHLEDLTISAQHARLTYHHGHWWVEDRGSTNGTFLNQEPVQAPLVLTEGDQLRVGQITFRVAFNERFVQELQAEHEGSAPAAGPDEKTFAKDET